MFDERLTAEQAEKFHQWMDERWWLFEPRDKPSVGASLWRSAQLWDELDPSK